VGQWLALAAVVLSVGLLWRRARRDDLRRASAWDPLARGFMLGFDAGTQSIRGKYRLLRVEITARRRFGLGALRTRVSGEYEGVVPNGLTLSARGSELRSSARSRETLAPWLDAHRRRELLPSLLQHGVQVSGHTVAVDVAGLLTDPDALRTLLGQLAELGKLLSLR